MVTEVKEGKLDGYRRHHDEIWPEVAAGLRAAGVRQLTIFNVPDSRRLCMYIEMAGNVDLGHATGPGSRYRQDSRCKEWEEMMDAEFHGGWTTCDEIHASDMEWNLAVQRPTAKAAPAKATKDSPKAAKDSPSAAPPGGGRRKPLGEAAADLRRRRKCLVTEVKEGKLEEYKNYHDNIWPEVAAGLRAAGIKQLIIFCVPGTRRLVMYIDLAGDIDFSTATGPGSRYRQNPKCKEWEELMDADFHGGWTECAEIHSSDIEWNVALQLPSVDVEEEAPPGKSALAPAPEDTWQLLCWPAKREGAGLAEYLRVLFEETGVSYEEVTADIAEYFSNSHQIGRPTDAGGMMPPLLGPPAIRRGPHFKLSQVTACAKFLAAQVGLHPTEPTQAIIADQIVATVHSFHQERGEAAAVKKYMAHFESVLMNNRDGNGFFVGDALTHADLQVMVMLQAVKAQWPETLSAQPCLEEFLTRMEARPRISEYLASPRRRPFVRV